MDTYLYRCLAAAGLAVVFAGGTAHAAADNADKSERTEERASAKDKRDSSKAPSRFQSCRRDARGKQGPERASFMTECLHDRH
jgi:hypothetical protein